MVFRITAVEHRAEIMVTHDEESDGLNLHFRMDPTAPEDDEPFYIPVEDVPAVIDALKKAYEHITSKKVS
ncbi:hypothetical protein [Enterobacter cloacae]|uniref:hypothetical protein n=1 Tax=Enterobacter cloacae TaxID=550 RepID=UPI00335643E0